MKMLFEKVSVSHFANTALAFTTGKKVKKSKILQSRPKNVAEEQVRYNLFGEGKAIASNISMRKVWTSKGKIPVNGWASQGDGKCNRDHAFRAEKFESFLVRTLGN